LTNEEAVPKKYVSVFSPLKQIDAKHLHLERQWNDLIELADTNLEYMSMNFGPYGYTPEILARRLDYYMTEDFRRKIYIAWYANQSFMFKIAEYRSTCLAALALSKRLRNQYTNEDVINLFDTLDMAPFQEIDCQKEAISPGNSVREMQLIYNFSSTSIHLEGSFIDGRFPFTLNIKPNEFSLLSHITQPIFNDNTRIIKLMEEGNCKTQYVSRKNGYLIIE